MAAAVVAVCRQGSRETMARIGPRPLREFEEGVELDDRRLMIPPEIKHRRSREREVEVRHPFLQHPLHRKRELSNTVASVR
jgi:hypothetical protein